MSADRPSRIAVLDDVSPWVVWSAGELDTLSPIERHALFAASVVRTLDDLPPRSRSRIFRPMRRQVCAAETFALLTGAPPVVPLDLPCDRPAHTLGPNRRPEVRGWITAAVWAHPEHVRSQPHRHRRPQNGATPMTDDSTGPRDQLAGAADVFDSVLRARVAEHPDIAVYLRIRERSRRTLARLCDPQSVTPEAIAWAMTALGAEDTEDAYRARADAVVDAIAGRTPEAAARAAVIATAEQAALTWLREVTGRAPTEEVASRLHETAVRHAAGLGYGAPAVALIEAAVGTLVDAARAGGGT